MIKLLDIAKFNFLKSSSSKGSQSSVSGSSSTASSQPLPTPSSSLPTRQTIISSTDALTGSAGLVSVQPTSNDIGTPSTHPPNESSTSSLQPVITAGTRAQLLGGNRPSGSTAYASNVNGTSTLLPSSPVVTLSWQPPLDLESTAERGSSNLVDDTSMVHVTEDPPSYEIARRRLPERPITYSLSTVGRTSSAGLLLPPPDFPDTRPLYYIAVCNSFIWPNCLITSLFRGSSADGHYVGGFSTIVSVYPHHTDAYRFSNLQTVTLGDKELPTAKLFELSETSHAVYVFTWRVEEPSKALVWQCSNWPLAGKGTIQCSHLLSPKVVVAHYAPNKRLTNKLAPHPPPEPLLTITPQGHRHIDDIVLSLLLVERERLAFAKRIATY